MKNIDIIINSNEYKCKLSEHLTSLLKRTKSSTSEASIAFAFESELYLFVRNVFDIDIDLRKEESKTTLRHKFIGRMDAICNNLVIEYKRHTKLNKDNDKINATNQISDYLLQLYNEEGIEYNGVLTDGIKIRYIYFQNGRIHYTSFKNIDEVDVDKLVKSLIYIKNKRFVPSNIVEDFRLNSKSGITSILANYLFKKLRSHYTGKVAMLFQEWEVLFHLSENDKGQNDDINKRRKVLGKLFGISIDNSQDDYKALFALQTTYAIIVKLIACKVITKIAFNKDIEYFSDLTAIDSQTLRRFIEYIEDGYVFQTGGVRNLLEGDFFSWYCIEDIWSEEESTVITQIIQILEGYSSSYFRHGYSTIDVFKDLYMEIIPQEVRHSLGEYFTPQWLADYVVKDSVSLCDNMNYKAIDPCCGSGVFVIALIRRIIGEVDIISLSNTDKKTLLDSILHRIKGIDINPLSVLTARVSFYLAIRPLINGDDIEIPIYLGDSANIPSRVKVDQVDCYQYVINTKQENINVILPSSFVENPNFFSMMSQIQAIIKAEEPTLVYSKFTANIKDEHLTVEIKKHIQVLSEQLIELHKLRWDGIWIRIVSNFMLVARIKEVDIIVGNPPWIKWEFLPQAYAEKIKKLCLERHLFSGQTYMGAISLNICALIANVTSSAWLTENGVLSFLMPQTLMTQDSYAGFRNFYIDFDTHKRMYLQYLHDWTKSGNPFIDTQEKFMTYFYKYKHVDYFTDGIPIIAIKKKRDKSILEINTKQTFDEVDSCFEFSDMKAFQMDSNRTGYTTFDSNKITNKADYDIIIGECDYKARSGVEFTPAEVYFIEPIGSSTSKSNSFKFKPSEFKNSKYKAISNLPVELEIDYIKPVIKAPDIRAFGINDNNTYCIFPYNDNNSKSIEVNELSNKCPSLMGYLINNKNIIGKQSQRSLTISRGSAFYSLSKVGAYTFAPHMVTFRDNTKLDAAVVSSVKTAWGHEIMPICAKHCPYISQDKYGRNITEDEAFYLCGILNSPIVKSFFKYTYSTRSYSINFNIKMPLYDNTNKYQRLLMKLARRATSKMPSDKIYALINHCYLMLCTNFDKYKISDI